MDDVCEVIIVSALIYFKAFIPSVTLTLAFPQVYIDFLFVSFSCFLTESSAGQIQALIFLES